MRRLELSSADWQVHTLCRRRACQATAERLPDLRGLTSEVVRIPSAQDSRGGGYHSLCPRRAGALDSTNSLVSQCSLMNRG